MRDTPLQIRTHDHLRERWSSLGFDALALDEKETVALYWLEGEVMNGGLHQFFGNSSGDLTNYVVSGLSRLGATQTLSALEAALAKLGAGPMVCDPTVREECLRQLGLDSDPFEFETLTIQKLPELFFRSALDALAVKYFPAHV